MVRWVVGAALSVSLACAVAAESPQDDLNIVVDLGVEKSHWASLNREAYSAVLRAGKYTALVVPAQSRQHAFDIVARSMITRYTSALLRESGANVPESTLVEMALGANVRRYSDEDVYALANSLNIPKLVWIFADHDNAGHARFAITIQTTNIGPLSSQSPAVEHEWNNIRIDDESPPESRFVEQLDDINGFVNGNTRRAPPRKSKSAPATMPETLDPTKLDDNSSPVVQARYFQLLGMLIDPGDFRQTERLFERSLVALRGVEPLNSELRVMRARALFYLNRRPVAMKVLSDDKSDAAVALRAFMNGNLPELIAAATRPKDPLLRLFSQIELQDLHEKYRGYFDPDLKIDTSKMSPEIKYFVERRAESNDPWNVEGNLRVKAILDSVFPVSAASANALVMGGLARPGVDADAEIPGSVGEHILRALKDKPAQWCCETNSDHPGALDRLQFLEALGEINLLRACNRSTALRGVPEESRVLLDQVDYLYAGHPRFALAKYEALEREANLQSGLKQQKLLSEAASLTLPLFVWSGGQLYETAIVYTDALSEINERAYARDEKTRVAIERSLPVLTYQSDFPTHLNWFRPNDIRTISYSRDNPYWLSSIYFHLGVNSSEGERLLKENSNRFIGSPRLLDFQVERLHALNDTESEFKLYQKLIDEKDTYFIPYTNVALRKIRDREYDQAERIVMSHPFLKEEKGGSKISLSKFVERIGSELYWRGAVENARRLYEKTTSFGTGSHAEMAAAQRLSLMSGDYLAATFHALQRGQRYRSSYGLRTYMSLLHLLGEHKQAWTTFELVFEKIPSHLYYEAAFIGHRSENADTRKLVEWEQQPFIRQTEAAGSDEAVRYLFTQLNLDRPHNTDFPKALSEVFGNDAGTKYERWLQRDAMYNAIKERNFEKALKAIMPLWKKEVSVARVPSPDDITWYPYYAIAAIHGAEFHEIDKIATVANSFNSGLYEENKFEGALCLAIVHASQQRHDEAVTALRDAFGLRPHTEKRTFFTWYEIVEIAEMLYLDTNRAEYKALVLEWSKAHQAVYPQFAWAYAVEAKYTDNETDRIRALAIAEYLDAKSAHLSGFDESARVKAREWFKVNNPFDPQKLMKKMNPQQS